MKKNLTHIVLFRFFVTLKKSKNMKKSIVLLGFSLLFGTNAMTQAPAFQWRHSIGGNSFDSGESIEQTQDKGYIMAGTSYSNNNGDVGPNHGGDDFWVVKMDSNTNIQWKKMFGGSGSDYCKVARQTPDGGYFVAGYTESMNGDVIGNHSNQYDVWVLKLNSTGDVVWKKTYGGYDYDELRDARVTQDGGYILACNTYSIDGDVSGNHGDEDVWLVKLNSTGNIVWQKTLGGVAPEWASTVRQTSDGGYVVSGLSGSASINGQTTGNHGGEDVWVAKLDANGNYLWHKSYGGTGNEHGTSIQQTQDGGYIVAAITYSTNGDITSSHGSGEAWVIKLNGSGALVWQKCFGGTNYDEAQAVQQTLDGGYVVGGICKSADGDVVGNHGLEDFWLFKLNSTGTMQWQKAMGGPSTDELVDLCIMSDGGVAMVGPTWKPWSGPTGDVIGHHGEIDAWLVKLEGPYTCSNSNEPNDNLSLARDIPMNMEVFGQIASSGDKDYLKFTAPALSHVSISLSGLPADYSLKVYTLAGVEIGSSQNSGTASENIWLSNLASGTYVAYIYSASGSYSSSSCYTLKVTNVPTTACFNTNEPNESYASAKPIVMNSSLFGQIVGSSDKDYLKFTTTSFNDITVTLSNLPANYDLKLYNGSGVQIGASANLGTNSEVITLTNLAPGSYVAYVYGNAGASSSNCYTIKVSTTPASCFNSYEPNETQSTSMAIPINTEVKGQIATSTDKDYLKFTLSSALTDVTITLSTLPANYNMKLYSSSGTQLGSSQNIGTQSEVIALSSLSSGTYFVYIYSYAGAYSNTNCYTLKVATGIISKMAEEENSGNQDQDMVTLPLEEEMNLFPNPAHDRMTMLYGHHKAESARLNVIDPVTGRLVKTLNLNLIEGENRVEMEVFDLARGLYFMVLEGQDWKKAQRLILE